MQAGQQLLVWQFVLKNLKEGVPVALLYVVESKGSSPGRRDFMMAANRDQCSGTIGGGIMEYKLVELSRELLPGMRQKIILKTQYHDKEHSIDQSGMICSGMQRVVIMLNSSLKVDVVQSLIQCISAGLQGQIEISTSGLYFHSGVERINEFNIQSEDESKCIGMVGVRPRLHIIGGGHVSLALSELMSRLGFYVIVYDDRSELNTFEENRYADEKHFVQYEEIGVFLKSTQEDYLAIMTIGYRTDKIVLKQLLGMQHCYLGMLGSVAKINQLFRELRQEGYSSEQLARVHAPIGLQVHSKTAVEIAVSIAAQIIREKNKN